MSDSAAPAVELRDVTVEYPIYAAGARSLRTALLQGGVGGFIGRDRKKRPVVEALRRITLQIDQGERVGLIGRNGAGKTTLLKVLSGVCYPSAGTYLHRGKISSLMAAGSFMEPEMTGYENIYYMGLLMGFSRAEVDRLMPEIETFTELSEYLHMPTRTYSSGMRLRLSFAMITSIEPDILILDEAIGAGDAHFVKKAMERATQFYQQANVIVIASHSFEILRQMCNRAILLEKGEILHDGSVDETIEAYKALS